MLLLATRNGLVTKKINMSLPPSIQVWYTDDIEVVYYLYDVDTYTI